MAAKLIKIYCICSIALVFLFMVQQAQAKSLVTSLQHRDDKTPSAKIQPDEAKILAHKIQMLRLIASLPYEGGEIDGEYRGRTFYECVIECEKNAYLCRETRRMKKLKRQDHVCQDKRENCLEHC